MPGTARSSVTRNGVAYGTYGYNALNRWSAQHVGAGRASGTIALHLRPRRPPDRRGRWRNRRHAPGIYLAGGQRQRARRPAAGHRRRRHHRTPLHGPRRSPRPPHPHDQSQPRHRLAGHLQALRRSRTPSPAPASPDLRFPGQFFLIETGLAYNWHRHYDPVTGRYTQPTRSGSSMGRVSMRMRGAVRL